MQLKLSIKAILLLMCPLTHSLTESPVVYKQGYTSESPGEHFKNT